MTCTWSSLSSASSSLPGAEKKPYEAAEEVSRRAQVQFPWNLPISSRDWLVFRRSAMANASFLVASSDKAVVDERLWSNRFRISDNMFFLAVSVGYRYGLLFDFYFLIFCVQQKDFNVDRNVCQVSLGVAGNVYVSGQGLEVSCRKSWILHARMNIYLHVGMSACTLYMP